MFVALQIVRIVAVIALVCVAGALATPKGRIPLALRGLAKVVSGDSRYHAGRRDGDGTVSSGKRLLAFTLVICAIAIALI